MTQTIRILIAEDHPLIREAIARLLDSQDGMTVIGRASNGTEAVELAAGLHPDVVTMDYEMPEKDGATATKEILAANSDIKVIGYSMHDNGPVEQEMLDAGAAVHVSKHRDNADLLAAIRVHAGTAS